MNTNSKTQSHYIPALGYHAPTGLYDPVVRLTTRESTFKPALIAQAQLRAGDRVLDLACGTATLTLAAKRAQPEVELHGLDGDAAILKLAADKAQRAGLDLHLQQGLADAMPYPDAHFDRALCSLFFHHLSADGKRAAFAELHRVLKAGGALHVADWGQARSLIARTAFLGIQLLDGFKTTADNVRGLLPQFMRDAGFSDVAETRRYNTLFGTISLYCARKSE